MLHIVDAPPPRRPLPHQRAEPREPKEPREKEEREAPPPPKHIPRRRLARADEGGRLTVEKFDPALASPLPSTLPLSVGEGALTASTFGEMALDEYLKRQLHKLGLHSLTPVQRRAIPHVLDGRDLVVRSPTGSGKTYAYAVPVVQRLVELGPSVVTRPAGTFALVLVPTRELALQSHEALEALTRPYPWLVTCAIMGGERRKAEKARLRKGTALVVSTPGRLTDHLSSTSAFELRCCRVLVLDEADRLLQMGFADAIHQTLRALDERAKKPALAVSQECDGGTGGRAMSKWLAQRRQVVCLSATLPSTLKELAGHSLQDHLTLDLAREGSDHPTPQPDGAAGCASSARSAQGGQPAAAEADGETPPDRFDAPKQLRQSYVVVPPKARLTALIAFLRSRCGSGSERTSSSERTPSSTSTSAPTGPGRGDAGDAGGSKALVFLSSCDGVDFTYELLRRARDWPSLHEAKVATGHAAASGVIGRSEAGATAIHAGFPTEDSGDDEGAEDWGASEGEESEWKPKSHGPQGSSRGAGGAPSEGDAEESPKIKLGLGCYSRLLGTTVLRLHGQLAQAERVEVFRRFRTLKAGVLLCTDIAARGLNLDSVHWVVQYDLPQEHTEYVHRVGRTARLGQQGRALLFLQPSEAPYLTLLQSCGIRPEELRFASLQQALCGRNASSRDIYVMELALQKLLESTVDSEPMLHALSSSAYQSFLRAYAAHSKAEKRVLHVSMLHLGHLAKAFALKETPTAISRQQNKRRAKAPPPAATKRRRPSHLHQLAAYGGGDSGKRSKAQSQKDAAARQRQQEKRLAISEFSAAI